jgi:hypothetical protein
VKALPGTPPVGWTVQRRLPHRAGGSAFSNGPEGGRDV